MARGLLSVRGYGDFKRTLDMVEKAFTSEIEIAMLRSIVAVEAEAKRLVTRGSLRAIETGILRASIVGIITEVTRRMIKGQVGVNVFYGLYVHEGTSKMKPRPFLLQALKNKREFVEQQLRNALKKVA